MAEAEIENPHLKILHGFPYFEYISKWNILQHRMNPTRNKMYGSCIRDKRN